MIMLRITAERGIEHRSSVRRTLRVQILPQSSSVAAAIFSRASFTPLSKIPSNSAREAPCEASA